MLLKAKQLSMLKIVGESILQKFKDKFILQGHNLTGESIKEMEVKIREQSRKICMEFFFLERNIYTEKGVKPSEIKYPYAKDRIEGLKEFVKRRNIATAIEEITAIAYAIATKHKQEGMHTKNSQRFSQNREREGFIASTISDDKKEIEAEIQNVISEIVETTFVETLKLAA